MLYYVPIVPTFYVYITICLETKRNRFRDLRVQKKISSP